MTFPPSSSLTITKVAETLDSPSCVCERALGRTEAPPPIQVPPPRPGCLQSLRIMHIDEAVNWHNSLLASQQCGLEDFRASSRESHESG